MPSIRFPTILFTAAPRSAAMRLQAQLATAQVELASGRKEDLGLALGAGVSKVIDLDWQVSSWRNDSARIASMRSRAEATQNALSGLSALSSSFLETLTGARSATTGPEVARAAARDAVENLSSVLNTTYAGTFLFGGLNSQTAPLPAYEGSSGQQSIRDAFLATFGFDLSDPAVSTIDPSQMSSFLDGTFASLFDGPAWQSTWTTAAPDNPRLTVAGGQSFDASANATRDFAARLTQAFTMIVELGGAGLSQDTFTALTDKAMSVVASAQDSLIGEQTRIGIAQQRLQSLQDRAEVNANTVEKALAGLVAADPYQLSLEINSLSTQLQSSYTMTSRLSQLSLLSSI